ncbi:hypothetical protein HAX54_002726, partial [Datura stramonium]|nr:hypothetical protein [Datura stramonium]
AQPFPILDCSVPAISFFWPILELCCYDSMFRHPWNVESTSGPYDSTFCYLEGQQLSAGPCFHAVL